MSSLVALTISSRAQPIIVAAHPGHSPSRSPESDPRRNSAAAETIRSLCADPLSRKHCKRMAIDMTPVHHSGVADRSPLARSSTNSSQERGDAIRPDDDCYALLVKELVTIQGPEAAAG